MAKKESKEKKDKKPGKVMTIIKDERFSFVIGIVLAFITLYITLALISFLFSGAHDQSIVTDSVARSEMKREVQNWTGIRGACIAEFLINECFGIASYILLIIPFAISLKLLKVYEKPIWKAILFPLLFTSWVPLMSDFIFGSLLDRSFFSIGGAYGAYMSDTLISNIGYPGTLMVIIATFIIFATFAFHATIPTIRKVLAKKRKEHIDNESIDGDTEKSRRIGDDIVPGEWTVENKDSENEEKKDTDTFGFDDIEITTTETDEDRTDESDDDDIKIETVTVEDDTDEGKQTYDNEGEEDENIETDKDKEEIIESIAPCEDNETDENMEPYDPTLDLSMYNYPVLDLLKDYTQPNSTPTEEEKKANQVKIITTLKNFGIGVKKIYETIGPTVTLYEIVPEDGVRISKIKNLADDIMLSLAATGIRIIAPMPGKGTIGIEVPNANPKIVSMRGIIASKKFQESTYELPVALGRTITNEVFTFDLCKMPHLLVAGATGQGKSVGLNAIITSLLYKKHPSQLKFVLVDPKKVEFNIYGDIEKHFLAQIPDAEEPVITDTDKVVATLNSLCKEMDSRYDLLKSAHVRNIKEYNEKFINRRLNPLKGHKYLPYIVVIVDEFGDLIMTAGKEVELPIARIAQLARAVGIHMILATQRPSVNIITGVIKANFPARIAFRVQSGVDSKTILDGPGAQQLIGRGDLLFSQGGEPVRVQCAFVDTPEVEDIVEFISRQQGYPSAFELPEPDVEEGADLSGVDLAKRDPYFEEVARYVVSSQMGSTSNIQRKFEIGFNRAGRIMDQLEVAGIVGPTKGSKPREVLIQTDYELENLLHSL